MVAATMVGGMWLAGHAASAVVARPMRPLIIAVAGIFLVVSGANALNMYIERESDKLMARTKNRPLPSGRMAPAVALWFGMALSAVSIPLLTFGVNAATGLLAALAL